MGQRILSRSQDHFLSIISSPQGPPVCFENTSLLAAASNLFSILISIKSSYTSKDITYLRNLLIRELNEFIQKASLAGDPIRTILAAKYCLCAAIDEVIMSTPWGRESSWDEMSLLSYFYKETFGGERFFIILQNLLKDPRANISLLQFLYVLLILGFEGKYYNNDPLVLQAVKYDLFQKISPYLSRGKDYLVDPYLYPPPDRSLPMPLWALIPSAGLVLLVITLIMSYQLGTLAKPIFIALETINHKLQQDSLSGVFNEKIS